MRVFVYLCFQVRAKEAEVEDLRRAYEGVTSENRRCAHGVAAC